VERVAAAYAVMYVVHMNFTDHHYSALLDLLEAAHESISQTRNIMDAMLNVLLDAVDTNLEIETSTTSVTVDVPEYEQLQLFDPSNY
jgi:hypothetical protein